MNLQEELKVLKERIAELEEQAKKEKEFLENGDVYWYVDNDTEVMSLEWCDSGYSPNRLSIGNVFHTKEQAEFAVEKLKVEAELRKFSRPFDEDNTNYFIELSRFDKTLTIADDECWQIQGTIYFESTKIANEAIDTIGAERIKKYIFGVKE